MKLSNRGVIYGAALACCLALGKTAAQEENAVCGTVNEPEVIASGALRKSADLPKVNKVWSGTLKALVIRISFSDAPYAIDTSVINKTNATINTLYLAMSRNTFSWAFRLHPAILVAPGNRATYAANFASLQAWIAAQITAAGLKRGIDYDVYIANFPQIGVSWAGLSNLRDADWINGSYSAGVTGHELGHSLGLPHAHSVEAGADMFGTPGNTAETNEYGNPYDIMGHGGSTGHFNVLYKMRVGWADTDEIKEVKSSGVYRIYAQDNSLHKSRLIGMRVPSGNPSYAYWFEYRTVSTSARLGASVMFQGFKSTTNLDDWFLDTTPGSRPSSDENDGVLSAGRQFQDKYGEQTFKALAINANTWNQDGWVDIQVTLPAAAPIMPLARTSLIREVFDLKGPAFNLAGRSVDAPIKRALVLQKGETSPRLILLAH